MKLYSLLFIIIILCISVDSFGQESDHIYQKPKKVIKINPISPFLRTINLSYQKANSLKSATQLKIIYTYWSPGFTYSGYGITPEYMFYFKETAPKGFYISIFGRYEHYKLQAGRETHFTTTVSAGITTGYQFIFKDFVTLEGFLGNYYNYAFSEANDPSFPDRYDNSSGIGIRAGITFGFVIN